MYGWFTLGIGIYVMWLLLGSAILVFVLCFDRIFCFVSLDFGFLGHFIVFVCLRI